MYFLIYVIYDDGKDGYVQSVSGDGIVICRQKNMAKQFADEKSCRSMIERVRKINCEQSRKFVPLRIKERQ